MQFGRTEQRVKPGAMAHRDGLEPTLSAVSRNINLILLFPGNNGPPRPPPAAFFSVYRAVILELFHRPACIRAESSTAQSLGKLAEGDSAGP